MTAEYTRYRIKQDRLAAFEEAYRSAQQYLQASPHCINYELSHCTEDPELFVLRIEWVSVEEHLQGFRKGTELQGFLRVSTAVCPQHRRDAALCIDGGCWTRRGYCS